MRPRRTHRPRDGDDVRIVNAFSPERLSVPRSEGVVAELGDHRDGRAKACRLDRLVRPLPTVAQRECVAVERLAYFWERIDILRAMGHEPRLLLLLLLLTHASDARR